MPSSAGERASHPAPPETALVEAEARPRLRLLTRPEGLETAFLELEPGLRLRHAVCRSAAVRERGSFLLLPGRSEHIEKYYELIGDLSARGFDVFVLDWRGQGLSGGRLDRLPLRGYIPSYELYLQDLEAFFDAVVRPRARRPLHLLGHSMGGHLALRFLHDHQGDVTRAVLTAPMVDIRIGMMPRPLLHALVRSAMRLGWHHAYIPGHGDRGGLYGRFEDNRLTSCPDRFAAMKALVAATEGVALGGVTYQWLKATLDSVALVSRPGFAEAIATPVLVVSGGLDRVVSNAAQARLAARLPRGRLELLPTARHDILMEIDATRTRFFELFDAFMATAEDASQPRPATVESVP